MKAACGARNGSYCCHRAEGHSGRHQAKTIVRSRGVRFASWADAYGQVLFYSKGER